MLFNISKTGGGPLCVPVSGRLTRTVAKAHQKRCAELCFGLLCACVCVCCLQGMSGRAPPDPIEMSRLEQQAEAFEEALKQDPKDLQVGFGFWDWCYGGLKFRV